MGKSSGNLLMITPVDTGSRRKISKSPDPVISCSCIDAGVSKVDPPGNVMVQDG